ncbi:hypothetical protein ED733_003106 [Metarhizium rileyi]|uniref:Carboxylic ester hydrolase n=1 Tax=Metarhizium rileyi (strain RCEF 4871) TaxID=1649241 RepID=A0A5C6G6Y8_METRR|nr:hypothetical protein ED733_003106 [Metarhizium rileyi]
MAVLLSLLTLASACCASSLPVVDLGYQLHQAISFNSTSGQYKFSNIRYAAPPVGDLRFRAPAQPEEDRAQVQTGETGRICPQASPIWAQNIQPSFLLSLLSNTAFNQSTNISSYPYVPAKPDPRATEDCLFLDVVVPEKIFNGANSSRSAAPKSNLAPVLVWIYGGGYVAGEKDSNDATELIQRSEVVGDGLVYVAINYRLGAFGWLAGESLTANGVANAALHDQRFALEWVQKNIHLFGGDAKRVTVMGESAGGGSILHQITAYGGAGQPPPFQQAILQSPGWIPTPEKNQEPVLQEFLDILNVSTIEEARNLPSDDLMAANAYQIATKSSYGTFTYGPVVDGDFVPAQPAQLLKDGRFHHGINVMVGHNAAEGLLFSTPDGRNSSALSGLLEETLPSTKNATDYITDLLYPAQYDGTYGYTSPLMRLSTIISDVFFICNNDYVNRAYGNRTFSYLFSVPPALHGQDVLYTFYNKGFKLDDPSLAFLGVKNETIALVMQDYFTSFVQTSRPSSPLGPIFDEYGQARSLVNIGNDTIGPITDTTNATRCSFWQNLP